MVLRGMRADCLTAVLILRVYLIRFCESWAVGLASASVIFSTAVIQAHLSWWSCAER
jgi:hypothetical protein